MTPGPLLVYNPKRCPLRGPTAALRAARYVRGRRYAACTSKAARQVHMPTHIIKAGWQQQEQQRRVEYNLRVGRTFTQTYSPQKQVDIRCHAVTVAIVTLFRLSKFTNSCSLLCTARIGGRGMRRLNYSRLRTGQVLIGARAREGAAIPR